MIRPVEIGPGRLLGAVAIKRRISPASGEAAGT